MVPFKLLTFLVWIVFGLGLLFNDVLTEEYNRILIFNEPVSNKALEGHVIRKEKVSDHGSCRLMCYVEPNCVSINVGPLDEGTHICELNKATDESPSHSELVGRQRYTYYGVENPCHSNPCPGRHAICEVGFTDKGFRCVCREDYKEKYCGKGFIPGTDALCGSCYILFTAPVETWNNARAKCESLDAQLVKIDTAFENEFLKRTFLVSSGSPGVIYWIGLSDQEEEGKWKWTDGSLLGNYTNWEGDNPNDLGGQDCGHIALGTIYFRGYGSVGYDGEWNDLNCYGTLGYICEKMYP